MEKDKFINNKNKKIYYIYTALFCLISLSIFFIFIQKNKGFIWQADGLRQHYVILYDFNQMMRNLFQDGFSMLSWNMGLGLDVIRTIFILCFGRSVCIYYLIISNGIFGDNL